MSLAVGVKQMWGRVFQLQVAIIQWVSWRKYGAGQKVFIIEGPCCSWACCQDLDFKVMTVDRKKEVGKITKNWRGIGTEFLTDADTFSLTFPKNLDVPVKTTLLGAAILIDFAFFENSE